MKSKYYNKKVKYDGMVFDSVAEMRRYQELKLLERAGEIRELRTQVRYTLIPAQYEAYPRYGKNGSRLKDGRRLVEKEVSYIADFTYWDTKTMQEVVEDVKSEITRKKESYIIKRKLMMYIHGVKIREVVR